MPQITSLMPWSLNFPELSFNYKKVIKVCSTNEILNTDGMMKTDSVFFVSGDDAGAVQDRAVSRIAQELVTSRYDYALVEIDVSAHCNDLISIVDSDAVLSDILTIVTTEDSFHKKDEILSKINVDKAVIFVKGMRFANSTEMSVIEMIFRIISQVKVPLFISSVNRFLKYAIEKVSPNRSDDSILCAELSPPNKPELCEILKTKFKLSRKECDEFLTKNGFEMRPGNCFAYSTFQILCEQLDSKNVGVVINNLFFLYESHVTRKFTFSGQKIDEVMFYALLTKQSLKIYGFDNDISPSELVLLEKANFTYTTKKGESKFHHELLPDFLIARTIVQQSSHLFTHSPSSKEILIEHQFFKIRKFLDSYLAQDKYDDNDEYTKFCATLKSTIKYREMINHVIRNICEEGLFHLYKCLNFLPSRKNRRYCFRRAIASDGRLATALEKDDPKISMKMLESMVFEPENGIFHDLAKNDAIELMNRFNGVGKLKLLNTLLNKTEMKGCTPLHLASERGHADMVNLLILQLQSSSAIIIEVADNEKNNWTALHYAVLNGQRGTTEEILKHLSREKERTVKLDPILELLLEKGIYSCSCSQDEFFLQHKEECSIGEYEDLLHFIVEKNRDQVLHDFLKGRNAAFVAVEKLRPDILCIMENCGVDLGKCDWEGWTTLHIAASLGAEEVLPVLKKVPVNAQNSLGQTALHIAVEKKDEKFVKLLLHSRNADASLKDGRGRTPLSVALGQGSSEIAKLLQEKLGKQFSASE